jgi:hypothetical protein
MPRKEQSPQLAKQKTPASKTTGRNKSIDKSVPPPSKSPKKSTKKTTTKASQPSKIPKEPIELKGVVWERQPGEPIDWYEKFCRYRNSFKPCINTVYREYLIQKAVEAKYRKAPKGTEPTIDMEAIAASIEQQQVAGNWKRAIKVFRWHERIVAFEESEVNKRNEFWHNRCEQFREETWQAAQQIRAKALDMLKYPIARQRLQIVEDQNGNTISQTVIEPIKWSFKDVAALLKIADELGTTAVGNYGKAIDVLHSGGFKIQLPDDYYKTLNEQVQEDLDFDGDRAAKNPLGKEAMMAHYLMTEEELEEFGDL